MKERETQWILKTDVIFKNSNNSIQIFSSFGNNALNKGRGKTVMHHLVLPFQSFRVFVLLPMMVSLTSINVMPEIPHCCTQQNVF